MSRIVFLLFALAVVLTSTMAFAGDGELVLGQWSDGFWYPGRVAQVKDGDTLVAFYDGDALVLAADKVKKFDWKVGDALSCDWKRGGKYYDGKLTEMIGEFIHVDYNDGDKEDMGIGRCRTK
ncbi:MAG: hypothetical protein AUK47_15095 [Deltaproteobacteria bacterium CG2_30_63_29]|nr:MAG: hypothetical protein AUK47_15095 [Deltaproteobacteria bacterium CG2_30_63_29]PIW02328.1 MAG: hypothetical protein COW42_02150 [Deltaproteobacteria bacterium CG17_big_fil_post_rev_8_21_14_2_50_63_7]PJB33805.1 MAG: hypothetical protein CO108_30015 [Deltaproteobacteria bacterium CG_4_9_14_3_um_filter_63_12]